ncbi:MAG: hypothetical protein KDC46_00600 [Thermoleophilia bacterium]|nr:hypothetical protein [Thermoleophilia bacterium]
MASIGTELGTGWSRFLKGVSIDGERVADVLADQVRFRITRPGSTSLSHVVPDSAKARELWELPQTRTFVRGVLELANDVGTDPSPLTGFTLATSEAGYVVNRAVHGMKPGVAPTREAYEAAIDAATNHVAGTVAVRKGTWLHLGPKRSEGILWALDHPDVPRSEMPKRIRTSLGFGVKTLLHELDHVGTPTTPGTKHLDWLREGRAEVFARWPGRVPAAGRTLGLDVPTGVGHMADDTSTYRNEVAAVRALLRMAGVDTRRSSEFAAARELIGTVPEHKLAARLATAISKRHAIGDDEARLLRSKVRSLVNSKIAPDGSHADPRRVQRLSRGLEAARSDRIAAIRTA